MTIDVKKAWAAAAGLALAVTVAGGVAVGAGAEDWYDGDNATVPDHDQVDATLKLYNASGVEVTSGSIDQPLAAFAGSSADVRAGDTFATLFAYLPQSDTAPGAWSGVQVTGTDRFSGPGAVTAPAGLVGKPYVATGADDYTLADVVAALPNEEDGATFADVYALRLRTSSSTAGVSTTYAAAYLKVTGTQWAVTSAPVLGDGDPTATPTDTPSSTPTDPPSSTPSTTPSTGTSATPSPIPGAVTTTVSVAWPSGLTYGTAGSFGITVAGAGGTPTGSVELVSGSTSLGSATLAGGAATISVPGSALTPGTQSFQVRYAGVGGSFLASQSTTQSVAVAKAAPGKPVLKLTKKPSAKKAGVGTVTVATPAGLAKAGGKVQVVLKKGKKTLKASGVVKAGTATVKLPKLAKGSWAVTVTYAGDAHYATSKAATKVASK